MGGAIGACLFLAGALCYYGLDLIRMGYAYVGLLLFVLGLLMVDLAILISKIPE